MSREYKKLTKIIAKREEYEDGANVATHVDVHRCFCGLGRIEHHHTPGFDDDFFLIKCLICKRRYRYLCQSGYKWEVYKR